MLRAGLRAALCIPLFLACGIVFAQTGVGIAFLSDYLYRGVSLSNGKPTLSLSVAYDNPNGWYEIGAASDSTKTIAIAATVAVRCQPTQDHKYLKIYLF